MSILVKDIRKKFVALTDEQGYKKLLSPYVQSEVTKIYFVALDEQMGDKYSFVPRVKGWATKIYFVTLDERMSGKLYFVALHCHYRQQK